MVGLKQYFEHNLPQRVIILTRKQIIAASPPDACTFCKASDPCFVKGNRVGLRFFIFQEAGRECSNTCVNKARAYGFLKFSSGTTLVVCGRACARGKTERHTPTHNDESRMQKFPNLKPPEPLFFFDAVQ